MKPQDLIIRCYAERKNGVWQAFCLNFDLAAQGDSLKDVRKKLMSMIQDYVIDVLAEDGPDREYAVQLLTRKAPLSSWFRYYWISARCRVHDFKNGVCGTFDEIMPMVPSHRA